MSLLTTRLRRHHRPIRLLGVGVTNLDDPAQPQQLTLFDDDTGAA